MRFPCETRIGKILLLTCPYSAFYTHTLNKLTQRTFMRDLFRDFHTPDKMVAPAMKGVKVAN